MTSASARSAGCRVNPIPPISRLSPLNLYFSTIDAGYTISLEPEGDPDWGHYDSLSELALGRRFGELIVGAYGAK